MDIDIDCKTSFSPMPHFNVVHASMVKNNNLVKHPAGAYFQNMPIDPITKLAAIPYDKAEELGFFKIDFLHLSILDNFTSKDEIRALIKIPPNWALLERREIVEQLFQIRNHFDTIEKVRPRSVNDLADCIALIRPSKKHLISEYVKTSSTDREALRKQLYTPPTDGKAWFKKAHAVAYALTVVLQLHTIDGKASILKFE